MHAVFSLSLFALRSFTIIINSSSSPGVLLHREYGQPCPPMHENPLVHLRVHVAFVNYSSNKTISFSLYLNNIVAAIISKQSNHCTFFIEYVCVLCVHVKYNQNETIH